MKMSEPDYSCHRHDHYDRRNATLPACEMNVCRKSAPGMLAISDILSPELF
jgi:hypothetical protein